MVLLLYLVHLELYLCEYFLYTFCQWNATLGRDILFFVRKELLEYLIVVEKKEVFILHLCLK